MLFGFTQRSVWSILAPLPPALLPGSGWPSPGQVHWAARPGPCVWIGTRIEWPESPRCESLTPPAPHSETLSPTYRTTGGKHRLMYHFNHLNTSEETAAATEGFHTHCKHLHQQLLLLLLGLTLSFFIYLVAAGRQEAVVVVEEDWTPVLLLEDDGGMVTV